jgi:hypothetical protein
VESNGRNLVFSIVNKGIVFAGAKGSDVQSAVFPGVCVLPGGRWICAFRAAPEKQGTVGHKALITWSDDEGQSWREPVEPFAPPAIEGKPGICRSAQLTSLGGGEVLAAICWVDHSDPKLPFFNEETEGLLDTRILLARSEDEGETWSEPVPVDTSPFNVPTPITGPILQLRNDDLACQFETNKHYLDTSPWRHESVLMFSSDGGRTWPEHSVVTSDPDRRFFYWDQRPAVLADGTVLDLFWTFDRDEALYRNIHARRSTDHGRAWSELWDTGVPGQPAPPVSLPDGTIAMVYVDRTAAPVIKARASSDGGRAWPEETETALAKAETDSQTWRKSKMQDAWAEMGAFSIGLPATTPLPGGDVLVVYYSGPETDLTGIHWARLHVAGPAR